MHSTHDMNPLENAFGYCSICGDRYLGFSLRRVIKGEEDIYICPDCMDHRYEKGLDHKCVHCKENLTHWGDKCGKCEIR